MLTARGGRVGGHSESAAGTPAGRGVVGRWEGTVSVKAPPTVSSRAARGPMGSAGGSPELRAQGHVLP